MRDLIIYLIGHQRCDLLHLRHRQMEGQEREVAHFLVQAVIVYVFLK